MGESRRAGAGAAASSTPITMIAVAMLSIGVGASPSTGIARIDATAGISAMMAVAAAAPSSEGGGLHRPWRSRDRAKSALAPTP